MSDFSSVWYQKVLSPGRQSISSINNQQNNYSVVGSSHGFKNIASFKANKVQARLKAEARREEIRQQFESMYREYDISETTAKNVESEVELEPGTMKDKKASEKVPFTVDKLRAVVPRVISSVTSDGNVNLTQISQADPTEENMSASKRFELASAGLHRPSRIFMGPDGPITLATDSCIQRTCTSFAIDSALQPSHAAMRPDALLQHAPDEAHPPALPP
eukprot:CAMPEP_0172152486 /NCGR_PEP_ID=MMETSP1050-20130122/869_1 /TAXON_ID=233186 /ORGANISM="Cryptomonas curvata, Strain CCAP979/52" /LENGTH=218 /DNA_ID=CAMNT_0012820823 /DNA_START=86 /DNA_END=739 /DNA_ORIENTATION=+